MNHKIYFSISIEELFNVRQIYNQSNPVLTCEYDVEYARGPLPAHLIGRGAHERAVVLVVPGRVRQLATGAVHLDNPENTTTIEFEVLYLTKV